MVRMGPFGLRIRLGHIRPFFRLTVVIRPIAVVDIARSIHPNQPRPPARRLRHRRSLRRGRSLRSRSRSSRRSRSRSRNLRSSRRRRSRSRRRWSGRSRRIPLLHPLMSTASPLFARSRRVSPIFTLTGSSGRRLRQRHLRRQKPRRHRHQTNRCLHKQPPARFGFLRGPECHTPDTAKSYPIPPLLSLPAWPPKQKKPPFLTQMSHKLIPLRDSCE